MSRTSKKQFKRTVRLRIICALTSIAGIIFILVTPPYIDPLWVRYLLDISFVLIMAIDALYALCFGRLDYDIKIEVDEAMITFRMSENDIRKMVRYGLTVDRCSKDKRYMVVRDNHQSMIIPYSPDIQEFIEHSIYY